MNTFVYKNRNLIKKITAAACLMALFMVLPIITGSIPTVGKMLSPMHIPAFLSGAILGPWWGGLISFISPILRGAFFGSPALVPEKAFAMAFECMAYAMSFGIFKKLLPKNIGFTYASLAGGMIVGRLVGGLAKAVCLLAGFIKQYTVATFITAYFVDTLPAVILQLIIIPPILLALEKAGFFKSGSDLPIKDTSYGLSAGDAEENGALTGEGGGENE